MIGPLALQAIEYCPRSPDMFVLFNQYGLPSMQTFNSNFPNWYLLQCKPHQDDRAQLNLARQNYVTFRPQLMSERLLRGKPQQALESLFPGYLFIHLSHQDNWAPLRSTRGVSRIVEFNHSPATVADHVIEHLRARCREQHTMPDLKPGDPLQIVRGPLSDFEGVFLSMQGPERVMVLLRFLNRDQEIRIPLRDLERQRS